MSEPRVEINLLRHQQTVPTPPTHRRLVYFGLGVFLLLGLTMIGSKFIGHEPTYAAALPERPASPSLFQSVMATVPFLRQLPIFQSDGLIGEQQNRIDILLLGMGGPGHDGPLLTDTIMLASLDPTARRVGFLPIPRDLALPFPDGITRKANQANAISHLQKIGTGPDLSRALIGNILERQLPYHILVDFTGFARAIDAIGGVTIDVERPFVDAEFPDGIGKYKTLTFKAGPQNMNGARALEYIRSRHGTNSEASDFARSRRQERLLSALVDKVHSSTVFLNPRRLIALARELRDHITSNLPTSQSLHLLDLMRHVRRDKITYAEFGETPAGLLVPVVGDEGAYLLAPRGWNYHLLANVAAHILETPKESVKIIVENGTKIEGLAAQVSTQLTQLGFTVIATRNATLPSQHTTVIYDLTSGTKSDALKTLVKNTHGIVATDIPGYLTSNSAVSDLNAVHKRQAPNPEADFIVVLGSS